MQESGKYTRQINIVIDHIVTHIDRKLDVQSLAQLTSLSPYHFHRVFTSVIGEPLAKFVLRKRLELAAISLQADATKPIMNIAFEVGFNSVNVFCRNFKKSFGITAEEYRRKKQQENSKNHPLEDKISTYQRTYFHYFCSSKTLNIGDISMNCTFEIKTLEPIEVVYCRHYGSYSSMQVAFGKLMKWAYPRGLVAVPDFKMASVYHDDPQVTEEDKLVSDACIIVSEPVKTEGEIGSYTLNGGQYAVGRFEIAMDEFPLAWESMRTLMNEHGCQYCGTPFEVYLNNGEEHPDKKWLVDICIPVIKK